MSTGWEWLRALLSPVRVWVPRVWTPSLSKYVFNLVQIICHDLITFWSSWLQIFLFWLMCSAFCWMCSNPPSPRKLNSSWWPTVTWPNSPHRSTTRRSPSSSTRHVKFTNFLIVEIVSCLWSNHHHVFKIVFMIHHSCRRFVSKLC